MSRNVLSGDNHWGFSMLLGVKFIFKDRVVVVPDVSSKFTDLQDFSRHHKYDFDLEREVLNGYEAAEHEEGQGNGECKVHAEDNVKMDQPFMQHTPQLTMIEPEKTTAMSDEPASSKPQPLLDRSLVEDFEVQGPRDDPFVAAELGTINDLEELRDVLASMPMPSTPSIDAKRQHMFGSLKNINFPRLSVDEDAPNHTPSSAPTSQPNLFSRSPVQSSEEPAKSYAEVDADFRVSQISGSVGSDLPPFQKSSSPVEFDIGDKVAKSKDLVTGNQPQLFEGAECNHDVGPSLLSSQNMATASLPLSSYPNTLHIPVSLDEEAKSNPPDSPTASEYVIVSHADDPPIVTRLVKMGFRRSKILALHHTGIGDDDTLVAQLCNWTELEERGFKEEVGKAAVIFSPDDFVKASKFATMVSELSEMGFPLDSVVSAVQSSKMDKEEAVLRLLDSEKHSDVTPSPSYASNNVGFPQGSVSDAMPRQGGRKSKKKEKKPHLSSYLHARH
ncbi:Ubiquitin-associated protein 1 [Taenia solium]|eukprot:TsM_000567000 transcript=TsM_000567000 gene=TsM_000567000